MKRSRLRNKFLNTISDIDRKTYNKQCNLCAGFIRSEKKNFVSNINASDITDNKTFWKTENFSETISLDLPGRQFFFDERYFRFCLYFVSKKWLYLFIKVLLSVMSLVLILLTKFFFSLLIKLAQRLHCVLYAFLSMSLFVFKNLFLRRDLFMISLFIFLFMKGA